MTDKDQAAFNLSFNSKFNEQFNRDYVKQQQLLSQNTKLVRTRQSLEAERRDRIGQTSDLAPYDLFKEDTLRPSTIRKQAFGHQNAECNLLNQLFMSAENMENLQQRIRAEVYKATNQQHAIGRQSDTELAIVMRSIYFTYSKNLPTHIKEQIADLNDLVVQAVLPGILSGIQQHIKYLWDRSTQPMPLARPQNMSTAGMKQLPSVTSIFNT